MRRCSFLVLLAITALAPRVADAQQPGDRRVARLMDRLRDEMWTYRQELNYFQRAPEYRQLVELRYQLRTAAMELAESRDGDPEVGRKARAMAITARELYRLTSHLEDRADATTHDEARRRADSLADHAVEIRVLVGRLHESLRIDFGDRAAPGDRR